MRSKSRSITNGRSTRQSNTKTPEPVAEEEVKKVDPPVQPTTAPPALPDNHVEPLQFKKVASPEPAQTTPLLPKPTAAEDEWCALCEQDGHNIMNCPNEDKL